MWSRRGVLAAPGAADRAAVERAITATAEPAVEAVGHWFGDTGRGCIGLHDARSAADRSVPGYEFCASSMLGDVVVVRHSGERTVGPANGLSGSDLSWTEWKAGSAPD
ncbi:hypothetical protein [Streptomyces siamensis]|uniref:Uncharacterized protein n=1 Tax=Streptomyces siamensis TaxID=1274986 RepID=A0ABP9J963_9ACTN